MQSPHIHLFIVYFSFISFISHHLAFSSGAASHPCPWHIEEVSVHGSFFYNFSQLLVAFFIALS